jgi:hypothetical protein
MINLKQKKIELLRISLTAQRPDLLWVLEVDEMIEVDDLLGGELQSAVCDHFLEFGKDPGVKFDSNFRANMFGLELEDLIDDIGRLYQKRQKKW